MAYIVYTLTGSKILKGDRPTDYITIEQFLKKYPPLLDELMIDIDMNGQTVPNWGTKTPESRRGFIISINTSWSDVSISFRRLTGTIDYIILDSTWACVRPVTDPAPTTTPDRCPICGDRGHWQAMAVVCRNGHGPFIGGPL